MIGRRVTIKTGYQTVSAIQDLLEVKLGTGQAGFVLRAKVVQKSDEASTEAEELEVSVKRASGAYTSGTGGAAATVVKGQTGDAAHGLATVQRNNITTQVSGGTVDTIESGVFNVLAGEWEVAYTPELMIPIGPSEAAVLSIEAPADALTLEGVIDLLITHG
jgi:hypothetical protein